MPAIRMSQLDYDLHYVALARSVASASGCRRKAGAVIVIGDRVVATGCSATPAGMTLCAEGGCKRCAEETGILSGLLYDLCLCSHAEEIALLNAARHGVAVEGASVYLTHQACFPCLKALVQAGVAKVYYAEAWTSPSVELEELQDEYRTLAYHVPGGVRRVIGASSRATSRTPATGGTPAPIATPAFSSAAATGGTPVRPNGRKPVTRTKRA
jgi:dCMP deaminase